MFTKPVGEIKFWHLLLAVAAVVVLGVALYDMITVKNIVASGNNGSFLRVSYFSPLTAEEKAKIGADFDKSAAPKA